MIEEYCRGWIDEFSSTGGITRIRGWILHPTEALDSVTIHVDDRRLTHCPLAPHDGVAKTFPIIPHGLLSGFTLEAAIQLPDNHARKIAVHGCRDGRPVAGFVWHALTAPDRHPLPPPHLRQRVAGSDSPEVFAQGYQSAMDLLTAAGRHRPLEGIGRVLDWGCGCGRVARHLLDLLPKAEILGCDIDGEAAAWANEHLPPGRFCQSGPFPPLPFADRQFDLVLGSSVMTHLTRDLQPRWLAEIRRVMRDGGLFLASVHGSFAAHFNGLAAELERDGIHDGIIDRALDGIAPADYYRAVHQTRAYTEAAWSEHFEILDYITAGLMCFQDLVVMRAR